MSVDFSNSNTLARPLDGDEWWVDSEEAGFFSAYLSSMDLCSYLENDHPKDAFIALMVGIECYLKYAYALSRYFALLEHRKIRSINKFLQVREIQKSELKALAFGHDVKSILVDLKKLYSNMRTEREGIAISNFSAALQVSKTISSKDRNFAKISWVDFRYLDGRDPEIKDYTKCAIDKLRPVFENYRSLFFKGLK